MRSSAATRTIRVHVVHQRSHILARCVGLFFIYEEVGVRRYVFWDRVGYLNVPQCQVSGIVFLQVLTLAGAETHSATH